MTTDFCMEAVEEAVQGHGAPGIFNTDQGSQLTSAEFVNLIQGHGIKVSMDGQGRWVDNVLVERLWKSVKYEEVYLHAYDSVAHARQGLHRYFQFYNQRHPHSSLDGKTPDSMYLYLHGFNFAHPLAGLRLGGPVRLKIDANQPLRAAYAPGELPVQ